MVGEEEKSFTISYHIAENMRLKGEGLKLEAGIATLS